MTEVIFKEPKRTVMLDQFDQVDCRLKPTVKLKHGPDIGSSAFVVDGNKTIEIKPGEVKYIEIAGQLIEVTHKPLTRYSI